MTADLVGFELVRELAVISQGRNPVWTTQARLESGETSDPPGDVSDGVDTQNAIVTLWKVQLRRNAKFHGATVVVSTVDDASTYRVTINSTDFDYVASGGDGAKEILDGLATAINAGAEPVTAEVFQDSGSLTEASDLVPGFTEVMTVTSQNASASGADFTIATSVPAGSGALTDSADATDVSFKIWSLADDEESFSTHQNATFNNITQNLVDRANTAGLERVFIEVTATDGHVETKVGPCLLETEGES